MIDRSHPRPWYDTPAAHWLAVALWMGLIFAFSAQSRLPSAPQPWLDFLFKKSAHFAVFAMLAALLWRAFEWRPRAWIWAWLLTVIYAISDEWHQSFVPGRQVSALDLTADTLGVAAGYGLALSLRRRRAGSRP